MPSSWADVVFAGEADRAVLSRAVRRGTLRRLGTGIYTGAVDTYPDEVARRRWREILVHELPGAVIADCSARRGRPGDDGRLAVIHGRRRPLVLPGLEIVPRSDRAPDLGVIDLPDGVRLSTIARGLLDNVAGRGDRYLTAAEVEDWVVDLLNDHGEDRLNQVRDDARDLAVATGREAAFARLDRIVAAALATGAATDVITPALKARAGGRAYDRRRIERFEALAAALTRLAPEPLTDLPEDAPRRRLLPFYEAYFSNFIEGTEFEIDDAAAIIFDGEIPAERPADAHDVLGTYEVVADPGEIRRVPADAAAFVALLKERHGRILAARAEARPGQFKQRPNRAGSTVFVEPELVDGTLRAGHNVGQRLVDPFARAVYVMFLVTEVHPFTDGNGRVARVQMNAELVAASQIRIVIPTVYRSNYLAALKAATHVGSYDPLAATLRFAQRYTARIDFSSRQTAEAQLRATNAFRDPREADDLGIRLVLP
jgi:hypothetical protein